MLCRGLPSIDSPSGIYGEKEGGKQENLEHKKNKYGEGVPTLEVASPR